VYRFLLTPRWLATTLGAVAAVAVCVLMGTWQLGRFDTRVAAHRKAEERVSASGPAVPLARLLPPRRQSVRAGDVGRTVTATGRYDARHQLLVPHRTLGGRDGYYVLTPLRVDGAARAVAVVRGWHAGSVPAHAPAPPAGEVTVRGALQQPEGDDVQTGHPTSGLPTGQLGLIRASSLVNVLPYPVHDGWITLASADAGLRAVPPAAAGGGGLDAKAFQNLGYTGEWFVFAGFALFMWFRFVRREAETQRDIALGLLPGPGPGTDGEPATPAGEAAAAPGGTARTPAGEAAAAPGGTARTPAGEAAAAPGGTARTPASQPR
jgi:cytochrome oxidase assembly protein ShyY1